jgi:WhiB family redox-sensing transcriptional regulator
MTAGELPDELVARVRRLRRLRWVPDVVLAATVAADGLLRPPVSEDELSEAAGAVQPDREMAARMCAGCPVLDECLELDLRWMADGTVGVFAGLPESDRRALYPLWRAERDAATDRETDTD